MGWSRIWAIASNGFQEVIRDRLFYFVGFFAILLALTLRLLPEIAVGTDEKIFLDLGIAAIEVLSVIVAVFIGTALINKEIDKRTILVLIAKPISRAEFILGKHLGLSAVLAVLVTTMGAIYLTFLSWGGISYQPITIIVSLLFLLLQLVLLTAVAIAFGVFTSSILATLLSIGVYLMGQISGEILALGKLSDNPSIQKLTGFIYLILPDLSRLNLKNEAVYGILPPAMELLSNALYALFYTGILLILAIGVFAQREF